MAKQLDEQTVLNELHGESAFFRPSPSPEHEAKPQAVGVIKKVKKQRLHSSNVNPHDMSRPVDRPVSQSNGQPTDQPNGQFPTQPTEPSSNPSTSRVSIPPTSQSIGVTSDSSTNQLFDMSIVLPRPKAFYITEVQDEMLDGLVKKLTEKLKGKVGQKIDRSVVARLILEQIDLTSEQTAEQLADLMIRRLTSQLTSQSTG